MARKPRYSKTLVDRICKLLEEDSYSISEVCNIVGIADSTYYDWQATKPEFSESIKKAKDRFDETLIPEAKRSLRKKINGYTVTEKKTVTQDTGKKDEHTGKPIVKVKEHSVIEKHIQPDTAAIIFTLTNRDPENWKNRQDSNMNLKADIKGSVPITNWLKKNGTPKKDEE